MGGYKYTAGGGGAPGGALDTMTRVDVTDGTWTLHDWQGTASSITNSGGVNSCVLDTSAATKFVDGAVWTKELKTADGSDYDFTDKRVALDFYVHLPSTGWSDNSSPAQTGGDNNPPNASRSYAGIGIMTDPENLPTDASGPWPRDLLGCALEWKTHLSRMYRTFVRNTTNSYSHGAISVSSAALDIISAADVAANHRCSNRLEWSTTISKGEHWAAGVLDPAGGPDSYYAIWADRYDNGDRRTIAQFSASQHWGRTRTDRLHLFAYAGRGSGATGSITMKFDLYYNAVMFDGGNNPSGRTVLSGP